LTDPDTQPPLDGVKLTTLSSGDIPNAVQADNSLLIPNADGGSECFAYEVLRAAHCRFWR
jgi:hypothetical protein